MADRNGRKVAQQNPRDKFAALREAKLKGAGSRLQDYKVQEDDNVYDEVDENEYRHIVRKRLEDDDFVEDDDGSGYVDNGIDDWDNPQENSCSDEDIPKTKAKKSKDKAKAKKSHNDLHSMFSRKPSSLQREKPVMNSEHENDFMAGILGGLESALPDAAEKILKRKVNTIPFKPQTKSSSDLSSFDDILDPSSDSIDLDPHFRETFPETPSKKPRVSNVKNNHYQEYDDPVSMDVDEPQDGNDDGIDIQVKPLQARDLNAKRTFVNAVGSKPIEAKPKVPSIQEQDISTWTDVGNQMNLSKANDTTVGANISIFEENGSLCFFWFEYFEINGNLHLFGKVLDKNSKQYISCCVSVYNLDRNVFVLPRSRRFVHGHETDRTVDIEDVYHEFDAVRRKYKITKWQSKPVSRKYAFELPDVPQETDYLKVVYSFSQPTLPANLSGETFSRIFGGNRSAFELFVLKRKIMGPCWLEIKNATFSTKRLSWCKAEIEVSDMKMVRAFQDSDQNAPKETPPLCIATLTFRTIMNHKDNRKEIVLATALTYPNVSLEDTTPITKVPCSMVTAIRPLDHSFPSGFESLIPKQASRIECSRNERQLLSYLLTTISRTDPDIIVGHALDGADLDVLLHRLRDLKIPTWNRLGRLRRSQWPKMAGGFRKSSYHTKEVLTGRMLCDLLNFKDMISSTTWSLSEMVGTHLKRRREDIDPDKNSGYFDILRTDGASYLMRFVQHCQMDSAYIMQILMSHQILPLTKQLTNLAGNSWARTMLGARSERNAFLLLHEFHRAKYICPDPPTYAGRKVQTEEEIAEEGGNGAVNNGGGAKSSKKKDKYKGGLVFEPRRGLYDRYILVMDFNSLYPSIIQEYNIDFTTVDRHGTQAGEIDESGEENVPTVPDPDTPQGFLPRILGTLVNRRKAVKSLMKDKTTTPVKLAQYNIKQQALKLTANSMYGCLGLPGSRFYAKELAMLITFKGREILTNTKELAESLQLDVIYGDTDSVMINSKVTDMTMALQIGGEFKRKVNERYKLLEIDIDHVFTRLLLHKKKKYAALKAEEKNGKVVTELEIKGLDLKRREYCGLSKDIQEYVLEQILSGEDTEIVVERIHEYLFKVGNDMREGKYPLEKYIIFKSLGKDPGEYGTAKGQPHVQVALRMREKGQTVRQGSVIPHIFCIEQSHQKGEGLEDKETANKNRDVGSGVADRAYHPDEVRREESGLKIDQNYYILHQILSSVQRLCEPIEGTDNARLAECLGLDPKRFRNHFTSGRDEQQFQTLSSLISDEERFREAEPLNIRCRQCKQSFEFCGIVTEADKKTCLTTRGFVCPNEECGYVISLGSLGNQVNLSIRKHIQRYYEGWLVCEEPACRNRMRGMTVYGRRCVVPGCRGNVQYEYDNERLYTQLMYYDFIFDGDRAKKTAAAKKRDVEVVSALVEKNREALKQLSKIVGRYMERNGHRYVEMSCIFAELKM